MAISQYGAILTWDSRNNAFSHRKFYAQYSVMRYQKSLQQQFQFSLLTILFVRIKFFALKKNRVITMQFQFDCHDIHNMANRLNSYALLRADTPIKPLGISNRIPYTHLEAIRRYVLNSGAGKVSSKTLKSLEHKDIKPIDYFGINPKEKLKIFVLMWWFGKTITEHISIWAGLLKHFTTKKFHPCDNCLVMISIWNIFQLHILSPSRQTKESFCFVLSNKNFLRGGACSSFPIPCRQAWAAGHIKNHLVRFHLSKQM